MDSSKRDMVKKCAEEEIKMESIGASISDGDSAIGNGIKEIGGNDLERQHCTIHLTKSVKHNIMKDKLKMSMPERKHQQRKTSWTCQDWLKKDVLMSSPARHNSDKLGDRESNGNKWEQG